MTLDIGYVGQIAAGLLTTIEVALASLVLATCIGIAAALVARSGNRFAVALTRTYANVIRGVPDLLLMLMLFFGGQIALNKISEFLSFKSAPELSQFVSGVLTLGFIYGAYFMETFRGALMAIPAGQAEAARAFGMSNVQVNFRILLPQMIRFALPGYTNNWLVVTKSTALVSVIGLQDMMYRAKAAGVASRDSFTYLLLAGFGYLLITSVSLVIFKMVERKYSAGVRKEAHA